MNTLDYSAVCAALQEKIAALSEGLKSAREQLAGAEAQLAALEQQLQTLQAKLAADRHDGIHPGDLLKIGEYPQGKTGEVKPVEWIVLECNQNECLLLSRFMVEMKPFNETRNAAWADSDLRIWLNHTFFEEAFDEREKTMLLAHEVPADENPRYHASAGSSTEDPVFLLSIQEAKKLMPEEDALPMEFAGNTDAALPAWWLRTPGANYSYTAVVSLDGKIDYFGKKSHTDVCGVRPAVRIRV